MEIFGKVATMSIMPDMKRHALDRQTLAWLRWSGIAGSVGYVIGDVLLIGNSATASEFPHLAAYLDNRLIQRSALFLASSTERLAAGGLIDVFSTPLCLAGIWHILEASKSGGTRWSLPPFLLLVTAYSIAPFVHGSFFYVLLDRVLPQPLAAWLAGAGLSLGLLAFLSLSTVVLWNPRLPAPQESPPGR